ncbi:MULTISPECIES: DUF1090 domain-containing protein [Bordetella]|uniref:DUF1090 domain-containing protein n=2 Tax=Bordetella TaxID=517 RepID=A0A261V955_9BORD|nr:MULTISPECIES: DUF1090 domain-containing protein [Bordetella]MDM9558971.1 DUF1090 domain-containing protein [Bordetella petrii]OZI69693.1 hypothetical protein CAL24_23055 [Bordetella genomosp. 2]
MSLPRLCLPLAAAAALLAGAPGAQAAQDCTALRGCAAKFCHIENDIAAAQAQGNSRREAGLRRALSEARGSCSDESLRAERQQAVAEHREKVREREAELAEERREGDQDDIDKALRKLHEAQEELRQAQDELLK